MGKTAREIRSVVCKQIKEFGLSERVQVKARTIDLSDLTRSCVVVVEFRAPSTFFGSWYVFTTEQLNILDSLRKAHGFVINYF